jgi:hypothetical protein
MFDPKTFMNKYTGEPGFVTAPDDTMTNWPTLADMHALATATATKPELSTTAGVPPPVKAEAANMTELTPFTFISMAKTFTSLLLIQFPQDRYHRDILLAWYMPFRIFRLHTGPSCICNPSFHWPLLRPPRGRLVWQRRWIWGGEY